MILVLGILNMILLIWQLLTGMHYIRVSRRLHRRTGIALVIVAGLHACLALLA